MKPSERELKIAVNEKLKEWARTKVKQSIQSGKTLKPDNCSLCKKKFESKLIHAHHHDYHKPLDVKWICAYCHAKLDSKKIWRPGSLNGGAKTNERDVIRIRNLREKGLKIKELASLFNLKVPHIYLICSRKRWQHV